jgi:hypothetical protein
LNWARPWYPQPWIPAPYPGIWGYGPLQGWYRLFFGGPPMMPDPNWFEPPPGQTYKKSPMKPPKYPPPVAPLPEGPSGPGILV